MSDLTPIKYGVEFKRGISRDRHFIIYSLITVNEQIAVRPFLEVTRMLPRRDRPQSEISTSKIAHWIADRLNEDIYTLDQFPAFTVSLSRKGGADLLLDNYRVGRVYRKSQAYKLVEFLKKWEG